MEALTLVLERGYSLQRATDEVPGAPGTSSLCKHKNRAETVERWRQWRSRQKAEERARRKSEAAMLVIHDGLQITQVAERMGVSRHTVARWLAEEEQRQLMDQACEVAGLAGAVNLDVEIGVLGELARSAADDASRARAAKWAGDLKLSRLRLLVDLRRASTPDTVVHATASAQAGAGEGLPQIKAMLAQVAAAE